MSNYQKRTAGGSHFICLMYYFCLITWIILTRFSQINQITQLLCQDGNILTISTFHSVAIFSFFRGLDFQNFDIWISKGIFPQLLPSFSRNIVIHWISRTKVDFAFVERQTTLTGAWKCLQFDILAAESTSLQLGTSNFLSLSETNIGLDLKQILIQCTMCSS